MKIGIITHYYKSLNYGGNLQAYALCRVLNGLGEEPEQICFPFKGTDFSRKKGSNGWADKIGTSIKDGVIVRKVMHRAKRILKKRAVKFLIPTLAKKREKAFAHFSNKLIPHSDKVFDNTTIEACVGDYDAFITGSDQVWNLRWYNPIFFLGFVPKHKPKFSYGAGLSMDKLTGEEKKMFEKSLEDYVGVSVREKNAGIMLSEELQRDVEQVLDPTLLLSKDKWDEVCADRKINEKYLFCYFLGNDGKERRIAEKFAKKKNLKIVTIPHLYGEVVWRDMYFGDIKCECPSPEELISLIKYAEYVFTDSFHATVFASIYEKEYFVFPRKGQKGMDSRIYTLTQLLGSESRFCDSREKQCINYLLECDKIDYTCEAQALKAMREKSMEYLQNCLKKSKEMIDTDEI